MEQSGLLLLKKPKGISSHDLVMKARRSLSISRIGHTGTLDPMAEGLMILTVGKATKLLPYIVDHRKEYVAELQLGYETDSGDITGTRTGEKDVAAFSEEELIEVLNSFLGTSWQTPPMYSAKKVRGQKLYELARKNIEIERKQILIDISEIELLQLHENIIKFRVLCSSGTYVRVLCRDIARKLNNLGCMVSLLRTRINDFTLEMAHDLEQLENDEYQLIDPIDIISGYPLIHLDDLRDVYNGKRLELNLEEQTVFIVKDRELIAVYEKESNGFYRCRRGLW